MYQSNAMETRLRPARRDVKDRPERRLRVVRAPGGFAFVEEGFVAEKGDRPADLTWRGHREEHRPEGGGVGPSKRHDPVVE
jgi:hypothetical protein